MKYYLTTITLSQTDLIKLVYCLSDEELEDEDILDGINYNDDGEVNDFINAAISTIDGNIDYYYYDCGDIKLNILSDFDLIKTNFLKEFTNDEVIVDEIVYSVIESTDYNALWDILIKGAKKEYIDDETFFSASENVLNDEEIINESLDMSRASDEFRNNKDKLLEAIEIDSKNFQYASDELKNDKEVALKAIYQAGSNYAYIGEKLKNDEELILLALDRARFSWKVIDIINAMGDKLRNKDFIMKIVKDYNIGLNIIKSTFIDDEEVMLQALLNNPNAFTYLPDNYKINKTFIMKIIKPYKIRLNQLEDKFKNDKEVVLKAIESNPLDLEFASDEIKNTKRIVLKAVRLNGKALKFASDELKDDEEIVNEALKTYFSATNYASDRIKNKQNKKAEQISLF